MNHAPGAKRRVLIFSLVYYPRFVGGAEVALKELTDRLGDGYEFDMVTLRKHAPAFERVGNVNVYRVGWQWQSARTASSRIFPLAKTFFPVFAAMKAYTLHRQRPYDFAWSMMAAYAGFAALFFKLMHPRVPLLLTLQEGDPIPHIKRRARPVYPLFRMIFTKADTIQAISKYLGAFARDMGFTGPLEIIPNGVDLARFSAVPVPHEGTLLITTSRLVHKNAVDDIIRALVLLPDTVRLAVYGSGPQEFALKELAQHLGVAERTVFTGYVAHEELPAALAAADIFVRPSRSEGMGNSFIEAMAAGLPVIATQEGGIADFLFDEKRNPDTPATGWAVDADAPQQIADAVKEILTNPRKVQAVRENAYRLVRERYQWDDIAAQMQKVFDHIA